MADSWRTAEILDVAHLARQTFGDRDLERELLVLFEEQCDRLVPLIVGPGTPRARADAAHTLRGASSAIGANRVAALTAELEPLCVPKVPAASSASLAQRLVLAVEEVRGAIGRHRRSAA